VRPQSKEVLENEQNLDRNQGNQNSRLGSIDTTDSNITEADSRNPEQEQVSTTAVIVHRHQETAL